MKSLNLARAALTRRQLLLGACASTVLGACGGGDGSDAGPAQDPHAFRMAAETEPQQALLFSSPTLDYKTGWSMVDVQARMVRELIGEVQIVYLVNNTDEEAMMRSALATVGVDAQAVAQRVQFRQADHSDVWVRDFGGLFLKNGLGQTRVLDFDFDGYGYVPFGGPETAEFYGLDNDLSVRVAGRLGHELQRSNLIAEGGNLHVNGRGTVIATEIALLGRNPTWTRAQAETELKRMLNVRHVIWVPRSVASDAHTVLQTPYLIGDHAVYNYGVNHIDELVAWVDDRTLLLPQVSAADLAAAAAIGDPTAAINHQVLEGIAAVLAQATDQDGRSLKVLRVPEPGSIVVDITPEDVIWQSIADLDQHPVHRLQGADVFQRGDATRFMLAASYMNFVVANGVVLVPKLHKPGRDPDLAAKDEAFRNTIAVCYPGRRVVQMDVDALTIGGGGMHCITQHIPA